MKIIINLSVFILLFSCKHFIEGDDQEIIGMYKIINNADESIFVARHYYINLEAVDVASLENTTKIASKKELSEALQTLMKGRYWMLIFKQSTVDKYSWKEIQEKNLYDKKYAFTLKELEAINYTIVYDGK